MADIKMSVDDTLELDTIIKKDTGAVDPINVEEPSDFSEGSDFNLSGIQTKTGIFDPKKSGDYKLSVNGQILNVKVIKPSTIPSSGDLELRSDARNITASDGDSISSWTDEVNSNSFIQSTTSKQPVYKSSNVSGQPSVLFDGSGDYMDAGFSPISQPTTIAILGQYENVSTSDYWSYVWDSTTSTDRQGIFKVDGSDKYRVSANDGGVGFDGGSVDQNTTILFVSYNGSNSVFRQNGVQVATGDPSTDALDGLRLASKYDDSQYSNFNYTEVLVYGDDKTNIASDIEEYLDRDTSVLS